MRIVKVEGKACTVLCCQCGRSTQINTEGRADTFADLDGEAFKSYYCAECVPRKAESTAGLAGR